MSEYQYYEFQAIDRRLTDKEMRELRASSTRARITPASFINDYSWGGFRGDQDAWMEKYFDAFLYLANWGTHVFMLRLPAGALDLKTAKPYCSGQHTSARSKNGKTILRFTSEDESGGDWVDAEGQLSSIISVRSELANGDLRGLYLGWLLDVQQGELDDDDIEPPVPPGLSQLSASLESLATFLRIDPGLLHVAARTSPPMLDGPSQEDIRSWLSKLRPQEKDDVLARIMVGGDVAPAAELRARFAQHRAAADERGSSSTPRRTVGDILRERELAAEQRKRSAAAKAAKVKAEREHRAAVAREKYLDGIAGTERNLWKRIGALISTKQPESYDQAVALLVDLRDLAAREGGVDFRSRLEAVRAEHRRKATLIKRLDEAAL